MNRHRIPKIVVITGAESTGKSVLTRQLSKYFRAPSFSEFSREYIEQLQRPYTFNDVHKIAQMQKAQMTLAASLKSDLIFFDTWLIITMIWFEIVYNRVPSWLSEAIQNAPVSRFLLCDTDLPWIPDPVRENGGEMREILQARYVSILSGFGFRYDLISGHSDQRFNNAIEIIHQI